MSDDSLATSGNVQTQSQIEAGQLVKKAENLLWRQNRPADAAGVYSQALQLEPDLVPAHLGMAEANLALGQFTIARNAADYVRRLAPETIDGALAQAILLVLDRQFPAALEALEAINRKDPGRAYAHALKGYVQRSLRSDYDAVLAEAKAARLAGAPDVRGLFPRVDPLPAISQAPLPSALRDPGPLPATPARQEAWRPPNQARRTAVRLSFLTSQYPIGTFVIMGICIAVFLVQAYTTQPSMNILDVTNSPVTYGGQFDTIQFAHGQWWRLITSMFLHVGIIHLATNMLSLYFIAPFVERIYGLGRFLLMYFATGIIGGLTFYFIIGSQTDAAAVGASGAIAGIFGVLLVFFGVNRTRLGPVGNSIFGQLLFWLFVNVAFNVFGASALNLGWQAHLGGLLSGMALGALIPSRSRP